MHGITAQKQIFTEGNTLWGRQKKNMVWGHNMVVVYSILFFLGSELTYALLCCAGKHFSGGSHLSQIQ